MKKGFLLGFVLVLAMPTLIQADESRCVDQRAGLIRCGSGTVATNYGCSESWEVTCMPNNEIPMLEMRTSGGLGGPRLGSSRLIVSREGEVTLIVHRGGRKTTTAIAELSSRQVRRLQSLIDELSTVEPSRAQDDNQPRCMDAPSTTYRGVRSNFRTQMFAKKSFCVDFIQRDADDQPMEDAVQLLETLRQLRERAQRRAQQE